MHHIIKCIMKVGVKFMKNSICNRVLFCVVFTMCLFLLDVGLVDARIVSPEEFAEAYTKSINDMGGNISYKIGKNTIDFIDPPQTTPAFTFYYEPNYIEYSDYETNITEDVIIDQISTAFMLSFALNVMIDLSGYADAEPTVADSNQDYDKYGILMETEKYEFFSETSTAKGEYIRHFMLSLDTDKIANMYTSSETKQDPNPNTPQTPINDTLTLQATSITDKSVTIKPDFDTLDSSRCTIYRSTNAIDNYELLSTQPFLCSAGFTDKSVKSNSTYYYRISLEGSNAFSRSLTVQTKNEKTSTTVENLDTGVNSYFIPTIICVSASIVGLTSIKKRKVL